MHSLIPPFFPVYPDENTLKINKYFAEKCVNSNEAPSSYDIGFANIVFLCFTNRSGSNYIAQSIASSGLLNLAQEVFNFNRVIKVSEAKKFYSYLCYFKHILSGSGSDNVIVKVSAGQLIGLYNCGIFSTGKINAKFIHVFRDDVFAQAVSLYIANKTKSWTSEQGAIASVEELAFEPDLLMSMAHRLMCHNATFDLIFKMFGVAPFKVSYEQFLTEPAKWVSEIGHYIGIDDLLFDEKNITLKKQSNSTNTEMVAKLYERFSLK